MTLPLNHRRWGSGTPLVLVHGLGSSLEVWEPIVEALARHHEVIAVDLPGFGSSPSLPPGVRRDVPALTGALDEWLADAGIESAHVVGNSMGGWVALELGARGRAESVVAISPAGFGSELENRISKLNLLTQRAITRAIAPVAESAMGSTAARTAALQTACARPWRMTPQQAAGVITGYARASGLRQTIGPLFVERPRELERIRCPVSVLWGTRDLILPVSGAARVRDRIPHAEVERLPGLGHLPMFDDPEGVAERVLATTAYAGTASRSATGAGAGVT
jgi:pimeloyl-ACP methyl ester carboxylesterase